MKKKSITDTINEKLAKVPLNKRKTYIIIFCISIFFAAISKTAISLSSKRNTSHLEWMDSTNIRNFEQLNNELKMAEKELKGTRDSLQSLISAVDSFNLQLEDKNEEKK